MVVLERRTANMRIIFRFDGGSRCWSIASRENMERVMQVIESMSIWEYDGEKSIKVVIGDKRQTKNKSRTLRTNMPREVAILAIKQRLNEYKFIQDIKGKRYEFMLRNNTTKNIDSKTITFYSNDDFQTVFDDISEIVQAAIEREQSSRIVFADETSKNGSHIFCVKSVLTKQQKCKTVKLDGYSSGEFLNRIIETSRVISSG